MSNGEFFRKGDAVKVRLPGSIFDGQRAEVLACSAKKGSVGMMYRLKFKDKKGAAMCAGESLWFTHAEVREGARERCRLPRTWPGGS